MLPCSPRCVEPTDKEGSECMSKSSEKLKYVKTAKIKPKRCDNVRKSIKTAEIKPKKCVNV